MATGPARISFTNPSSGNAVALKVGLLSGPGFIDDFGSDASWYGHVVVPEGMTGTASIRVHVHSVATASDFQFDVLLVELSSAGGTASGATRTKIGATQTVTFSSPASEPNVKTIAIGSTPTAGNILEVEVKALAAGSTVSDHVRVDAYLIYT